MGLNHQARLRLITARAGLFRGVKTEMVNPTYVDKHGLKKVFPASSRTVYRLQSREDDPFPRGQLIGGKRYWRLDLVGDWLTRQDTSQDPENEAALAAADGRS